MAIAVPQRKGIVVVRWLSKIQRAGSGVVAVPCREESSDILSLNAAVSNFQSTVMSALTVKTTSLRNRTLSNFVPSPKLLSGSKARLRNLDKYGIRLSSFRSLGVCIQPSVAGCFISSAWVVSLSFTVRRTPFRSSSLFRALSTSFELSQLPLS